MIENLIEIITNWMENKGNEVFVEDNNLMYFDEDEEKFKFLCRINIKSLEKIIDEYNMDKKEFEMITNVEF